MQKQLSKQDMTNNKDSTKSWSQLYNKYKQIFKSKQKTDNIIKNIFGPVLIAMLPVNLIFLLSFTSLNLFYSMMLSIGVSFVLIHQTSYKQDSFMNMHIGVLYIALPTVFVLFSPLFYISTVIMTIVYVIKR